MSNPNPDEMMTQIRDLQRKLDQYSSKDRARASVQGLSEDFSNFSDKLHKSRHEMRDQLAEHFVQNKNVKMGIFIFWLVVTIVFLSLLAVVYAKTTHDNASMGLLISIIVLHLINLIGVAFNRTILSFVVSFVSFVLGMALLFKQEKDLDCGKDLSTYRVYMATHTFNLVLFFFSLMRLLV